MLTPLLQLLFCTGGVCYLIGLLRLVLAVRSAPVGYEDRDGFHYGCRS